MNYRILPLVLIAGMALAGCGNDRHEDLRQWMQASTKGLKGHVLPLPEIKPLPVVSFNAANARDPFRPMQIEAPKRGAGGLKPDFNRPRQPLEAFPLDSLKMVGEIQKGNVRHALIKAGTTVYQVAVGNYIGQNFGIITRITDDKVQLRELIQDPTGAWTERANALHLQQQETKK